MRFSTTKLRTPAAVTRRPKPHSSLSQHKRYPAAGGIVFLTDNSLSFILMRLSNAVVVFAATPGPEFTPTTRNRGSTAQPSDRKVKDNTTQGAPRHSGRIEKYNAAQKIKATV
jgi:hypothetical protein